MGPSLTHKSRMFCPNPRRQKTQDNGHSHRSEVLSTTLSLAFPKPPSASSLSHSSQGQRASDWQNTQTGGPQAPHRTTALLHQTGKRSSVSQALGCGLFSGRGAGFSRWEPSRPQGSGARQSGRVTHREVLQVGSTGAGSTSPGKSRESLYNSLLITNV